MRWDLGHCDEPDPTRDNYVKNFTPTIKVAAAVATHDVKAATIGNNWSDVCDDPELERVTFLVRASRQEIVRLRLPFGKRVVDATRAPTACPGTAAGGGAGGEGWVGEDKIRPEQLHGDLADLRFKGLSWEEREHLRPDIAWNTHN
jgi:hypothetical protein